MAKKLDYLDKRVSTTFSLQRKTILLLEKRTKELGVNKNSIIEQLILEWVIKMKNL